MLKYLIPYLPDLLFAASASGLTYLFARKKNQAEIDRIKTETELTELELTTAAIKIWRELAEDMRREVSTLRGIVNELKVENGKLKGEILELRKTYEANKP